MTPRLMARLFVVPLLIVALFVFSSAAVVLLFGWISESERQTVDDLVARVETGVGNLILGMAMLPQDREVWQAASELAGRLQSDNDADFPQAKRPEIAGRLAVVLEKTYGVAQHKMGQEMQQFLLVTVGKLGQPQHAELLLKYALDEKHAVDVRYKAVAALVDMRNTSPESLAAARATWPALATLLDSPHIVLRLASVAAVGALAAPGDKAAIDALTRASLSDNRGVILNATLALARLGRGRAVPPLLEMLDRNHWEKQHMDVPTPPDQEPPKLSQAFVINYLILSIDAAVKLGDPQLKPAIEKLADDPALQVKDHARKALDAWSGPASQPSSAITRRGGIAA